MAYDPDQPRDEQGQWTAGSSAGERTKDRKAIRNAAKIHKERPLGSGKIFGKPGVHVQITAAKTEKKLEGPVTIMPVVGRTSSGMLKFGKRYW